MGWEGKLAENPNYTGFNKHNNKVRVYNPITGEYEIKAVDNWKDWNPAGDNTNWMYDTEGNRVLGYTPEGYEERGAFNPELEGWQAGYQPPATETVWDPDGLRLGPGDRNPPPGSTQGPDGVYTKPNVPPTTVPPGDPFVPGGGATTTPIEWGSGGGVTGVDTGPEIGDVGYFDPQGFGNSTNEDFYAQQSAAQRTQQLRNAMREQVARENANNQPEAGPVSRRDMWDWTLGDKQTLGDRFGASIGTDTGSNPDGMVRNPYYEWNQGMSNADLLRAFSSAPVLQKYGDNLQDWITSQENDGGKNWSYYDPNNPNSAMPDNGNPLIGDLLNLMWTDQTKAEFGKPAAPYGYANPINTGDAQNGR